MRRIYLAALTLLLSACGSQPPKPVEVRGAAPVVVVPSEANNSGEAGVSQSTALRLCSGSAVLSGHCTPNPTGKPAPRKPTVVTKRGGGYYQDDGPGANAPTDLDAIPDATPKAEPLHRFANNPYSVLGRDYTPLKSADGYQARGIASWYGRKFHGQKTSSGEPYDMYGMSAAHPTLPIPSYVRVTNPANGKSVVVRVNDRGPFHAGRLIDLSYTAAWKLDYIGEGSTQVIVETVRPGGAATPPVATLIEVPPKPLLASAPATPLPTITVAGGQYIQLGAFSNLSNAQALQAHLARELGDMGDKLIIKSAGDLHRLQLGPWPDIASARSAAQVLTDTFGLKTTLPISASSGSPQ